MVEENLQALDSLLTREGEILQQLPTLEPGVELDTLLGELAESLQQFQSLLGQLSEMDLNSAASSTSDRLQELKQRRDQNAVLLQGILKRTSEKMTALQVEKKTLNKYRPAEQKEPRLLDNKR